MKHRKSSKSPEKLRMAIQNESRKFQDYYLWLEKAMPSTFFEEVSEENILLIAHNLIGFELQAYFSTIHLKNAVIVICLDGADADLRILKNYALYGIKNYQAYVSKEEIQLKSAQTANLRIAVVYFTEAFEIKEEFPAGIKQQLRSLVKEKNLELSEENFERLIGAMNARFLRSLPEDRLILAFEMFFRAQTRDNCQYVVQENPDWQKTGKASMQIVLAWKNIPKHNFLYRMARIIHRHHLIMKRVNAAYIHAYSRESILVMVLDIHGTDGRAVWDVADMTDFLRELVTVKYFASFDLIDSLLVSKGVISGNMGNFLRSMLVFIHQSLVHVDANLYTLDNIEDALCRHPELTAQLCQAFCMKFDPLLNNLVEYQKIHENFLANVERLDTGQEGNDVRRKTVLRQGINFIHYTLKTNCFCNNLTAHSFRLDPQYLDKIPFERENKFPEMPFAIFFIKGMHFFGFHIRFKNLARGGLRTVYPMHPEQGMHERQTIFTECYHLAFTQHLKNKDIPEGGAKGIIFLNPFDRLESEALIFQKELEASSLVPQEISDKVIFFRKEQRVEYLHQCQRSFVESLLTIINCDADGTIRAKNIIDYWRHPEYLYLGPDENMHDEMIQWIANLSVKYDYKPGRAFISGKPLTGINHKQYGVTSLGINVYMEALLNYLNIDPYKQIFSVKLSGGPDGDVAGNEIYNLYKYYPKTAKILALIDVSGTIYEPQGLDLEILAGLFREGKPLKYYPPERLSDGGLLLDKSTKRSKNHLAQQTLCWRKQNGKLEQDWVSSSEMNQILRTVVHQTKTDIFIPAGGRPRTLNEENIKDFLDEAGHPTARGIVEGANLYLTPKARRILEKLGVLIIKDSSANKTGVICSSFEVQCGLTLTDAQFLENKEQLVKEILERLKRCASQEAAVLLSSHRETGEWMTDISEQLSERINLYTYQLLDYLDTIPWKASDHALTRCYLSYCLPTLRNHFQNELLEKIPDHHKKAMVACHLAAQLVYKQGLEWQPTVVDILPLLLDHETTI